MRVKICGVCRPEDAALAAEAGADYVGVILSPSGPRAQAATSARAIWAEAGAAARVGVVVDEDGETLRGWVDTLALDVLQLHGSESPELAAALRDVGVEVWKAVRVRAPDDVAFAAEQWVGAVDALLLDGFAPGQAGGGGRRFAWREAAPVLAGLQPRPRIVLAGGLDPDNVAEAIATLQPAVVDVSSGVEERVCAKSPAAVRAFIASARRAGAGHEFP